MKQSRRHELKTNELSVFLRQAYAGARRNLQYVIGGLLVVAVVLVIGLYALHRRQNARETAWTKLDDLLHQQDSVAKKPSLLDEARKLAQDEQGHSELGCRSAMVTADMAYELAMSLDTTKDRDKRLALLGEARDRYQGLIDQYSDQPATVAAARLSLAAVEENLLLAGQSTKERVRAQYEALAKDEHGTYALLANHLLQTLDERTRPLNVVATRPAEPPATQPATGPAEAVGTRPSEPAIIRSTNPSTHPDAAPQNP